MPIKRIQLGGITRVPSDRMSESGAVAESLNVCMIGTEVAPIMPPEDLAPKFGLPTKEQTITTPLGATTTYRAVYLHKVSGKTIYIYVKTEGKTESLIAYTPAEQTIITLEAGETFIDDTIIALGNTLLFSTSAHNGYALYKDGVYKYLGEDIPDVAVSVKPNLYSEDARLDDDIPVSTLMDELLTASADVWNSQLKLDPKERNEFFDTTFNKDIWEGFEDKILGYRYFKYPVFVRFALKLYDGSYVHHTVPIFVSGGNIRYKISVCTYKDKKKSYYHFEQDGQAYKIKVSLTEEREVYENWKDVIQSIDMFISAPIIYPFVNSEPKFFHDVEVSSDGNTRTMYIDYDTVQGTDEEKTALKDVLLDKSRLFYKVRSFKIENLVELAAGVEIANSEELSYTEKLFTRESLPDDYRSNNSYRPERSYIINRRLLSVGMTENFGHGMSYLYGLVPTVQSSSEASKSYQFIYELTESDGVKRCVKNRGRLLTERLRCLPIKDGDSVGLGTMTYYASDCIQILFYPDNRCTGVYVIKSDGSAVKLEMRSHPYLNCAYYIGELTKRLSDLQYSDTLELPAEDNKGETYKYNYLFQSAVENPFYYPVTGRIKLSSEIIGVASISAALSEGQYGQFDLYVFTKEGIFALRMNDSGGYISINPVSRDICISPSGITSIDQAIVFLTDKGVMMLSGSQLSCLSLAMVGKSYTMEDSAQRLMDSRFVDTLVDDSTLISFLKSDKIQIGYDYSGSRLLFVNEEYQYIYIYMLGTQSWHKEILPVAYKTALVGSGELRRAKILNSYPDCLLFCASGADSLNIFDMTTNLVSIDETNDVPGVIATRAFNLDAPDILKTINHLKIRGQFAAKDANGKPKVTYVLLGSQDGKNFYRIKSLRGKSWKYYRIVINCNLKQTERISWIDIDYEMRFTNKLR